MAPPLPLEPPPPLQSPLPPSPPLQPPAMRAAWESPKRTPVGEERLEHVLKQAPSLPPLTQALTISASLGLEPQEPPQPYVPFQPVYPSPKAVPDVVGSLFGDIDADDTGLFGKKKKDPLLLAIKNVQVLPTMDSFLKFHLQCCYESACCHWQNALKNFVCKAFSFDKCEFEFQRPLEYMDYLLYRKNLGSSLESYCSGYLQTVLGLLTWA